FDRVEALVVGLDTDLGEESGRRREGGRGEREDTKAESGKNRRTHLEDSLGPRTDGNTRFSQTRTRLCDLGRELSVSILKIAPWSRDSPRMRGICGRGSYRSEGRIA